MAKLSTLSATAYHEAGHVVAAHALGLKVASATIRPSADASGQVVHSNPLRGIRLEFASPKRTQLQIEAAIMVCMSGPLAQRRYAPQSWCQWHGQADHTRAADLALRFNGEGEAASAHLRWLELRAAQLIEARWGQVARIAAALIGKQTVSAEEIRALVVARPSDPMLTGS